MTPTAERMIEANVRGYRRAARRYERVHGEIFNAGEQERLHAVLARAVALAPADEPHALDFGAGTGNLTRHLLELGARVTAADVSPDLLRMVASRFGPSGRVEIARLNGRDLAPFPDGGFDLAVSYSVLHHVPDYLAAVRELCRVLAPGGVLVIDHEFAPRAWDGDPQLEAFRAECLREQRERPKSLRRFLDPRHYAQFARHYHTLFRRRRDPRYWPEGDIHIWPDDHIEWPAVERVLAEQGLEVVERVDYLLRHRDVPDALYDAYRERTADTRLLIARRSAVA